MIFIVILLIVLFVIYYLYTLEPFRSGIPSGYGYVYSPQPPCNTKNNCHPGYYFRSQAYNNSPQFTALGSNNTMTKFKKPLTYF
jgi:hypothetical protein